MKKELEEKLFNDFPLLYVDRDRSAKESLMCFGFAVGDGWYEIIRDLSAALEPLIEKQKAPKARACQVKEKFGGLRFYMDYGNLEMHKLVQAAEERAWKTCDVCGKAGTTAAKRGQLSTRCEVCRDL